MDAVMEESSGSNRGGGEGVNVTNENQPLQISVTEKIIFCLDVTILSHYVGGAPLREEIIEMFNLFVTLKSQVNVRKVEFTHLFVINGSDIEEIDFKIGGKSDSPFLQLRSHISQPDFESFDLGVLFDLLARKILLPDARMCKESLPPPWVYRCILVFGRNVHVPIIRETNAFDFLVQSPFFFFDTIYIYEAIRRSNDHKKVASALRNMYESVNGYMFVVRHDEIQKQYGMFAQLMGHPLIRPTQSNSSFNVEEIRYGKRLS